jgi:hypothetical protein
MSKTSRLVTVLLDVRLLAACGQAEPEPSPTAMSPSPTPLPPTAEPTPEPEPTEPVADTPDEIVLTHTGPSETVALTMADLQGRPSGRRRSHWPAVAFSQARA